MNRNPKINAGILKNITIVDGDTVKGELLTGRWFPRYTPIVIRLAGIDTPELHPSPQPYAVEAKEFLAKQVCGKKIIVRYAIDESGQRIVESGGGWPARRLLGVLFAGRKNINVLLVRKGFARLYPSPTWMTDGFEQQLKAAEAYAIRKKSGIWKTNRKPAGQINRFDLFLFVIFCIELIILLTHAMWDR